MTDGPEGKDNMRKAMLAVLMVAAGGCGGSGSLKLQITDAPLQLANVKSVNVTLSKVEVHLAGKEAEHSDSLDGGESESTDGGKGESGAGWQTVQEGDLKLDLMQLRNNATQTLGELELPAGKITQIRLFLDTAKPENNTIAFNDGTVCNLDTSNVDQTGIKINHPFKALDVSSGKTTVTVDFDAESSVDDERTSSNACDLRLSPVIKIKAVDKDGKDEPFDDNGK